MLLNNDHVEPPKPEPVDYESAKMVMNLIQLDSQQAMSTLIVMCATCRTWAEEQRALKRKLREVPTA